MPCDFFLCGYITNNIHIPALSLDLTLWSSSRHCIYYFTYAIQNLEGTPTLWCVLCQKWDSHQVPVRSPSSCKVCLKLWQFLYKITCFPWPLEGVKELYETSCIITTQFSSSEILCLSLVCYKCVHSHGFPLQLNMQQTSSSSLQHKL